MGATASPAITQTPQQLCFEFTAAEAETLRSMAVLRGVSEDQIMREALVEKKFFDDQRRQGMQVLLQGTDGKLTPVSFSS